MIHELQMANFKLQNFTGTELTLSIPNKPLLEVSMEANGDQKIIAALETLDRFSIVIGNEENLMLELDDHGSISLASPLNGWSGGNSPQTPDLYLFSLKSTVFGVKIILSPSDDSIGIVIVGTVDAP